MGEAQSVCSWSSLTWWLLIALIVVSRVVFRALGREGELCEGRGAVPGLGGCGWALQEAEKVSEINLC